MKVAFTGGNGFVAAYLKNKFLDYVVINRQDTENEILKKLEGVDAVLNLAGAPIIKRWSDAYKKVLLSSRIETTKKIVKAINKSEVKHFISASAIGAYPDDIVCDESFEGYSDDFLGLLTKSWEDEASKCIKATTILRFGVILGNGGGALAQMLFPFRLGLGGTIGDGKIMMSWIDIDDLVRIYEYALEYKLTGLFNACSPNPVNNFTFTKVLGSQLHRPTMVPIPKFVLKLFFGEGASVLTGSKEIYPKQLLDRGFEFTYKNIDACLAHLLASKV